MSTDIAAAIRARLADDDCCLRCDEQSARTAALRAVLDVPDCRDSGHSEYIRAVIAEHLGIEVAP